MHLEQFDMGTFPRATVQAQTLTSRKRKIMTQFRAASTAIALVFSFLIIAAGNASAQTPPAATPAPSAAPQAAPAASAPKKPIAVIHFSPQDTSMVGSSDVPVPIAEGGATGNHQYNTATFRPGYAAQIYSGNVFASYTRLYVDQNNGRVTSLGNDYVYPNRIYDRVDDASLNVSIDSIIASAGFHQRVRQCCGNNPGAEANPTAYHLGRAILFIGLIVITIGAISWFTTDIVLPARGWFAISIPTLVIGLIVTSCGKTKV